MNQFSIMIFVAQGAWRRFKSVIEKGLGLASKCGRKISSAPKLAPTLMALVNALTKNPIGACVEAVQSVEEARSTMAVQPLSEEEEQLIAAQIAALKTITSQVGTTASPLQEPDDASPLQEPLVSKTRFIDGVYFVYI